jgi:hypothetical protein
MAFVKFNMPDPSSVWKYLSPETAQLVLEKRTLRFSPPTALNDRRDCIGDFQGRIEECINELNDTELYRGKTHLMDRNPIEKGLRKNLRQEANFRLLSLSLHDPRSKEAEPLWGNYASSAQGICIEFHLPSLLGQLKNELRACGAIAEPPAASVPVYHGLIAYNDTPAPWPLKSDSLAVGEKKMVDLVFRKLTCWQQENEYRIVIFNDPKCSVLQAPLFTWTFPLEIIRKIYLGAYAVPEIINLLGSLPAGIPIEQNIA